jgi:hypothetical protein
MSKKNSLFTGLLIMLFAFAALSCQKKHLFSVEQAQKSLAIAEQHYLAKIAATPKGLMPRSFQGDTLTYSNIWWWCSGFYPGTLWYLYEHSGNNLLKEEAQIRTLMLDTLQYRTNDHDLGFMLYCSYGNALRITGDSLTYKKPLINGAKSLATRFNEKAGCTKSWDWDGGKKWVYPVIIDNMMNLELLMWAAKNAPDSSLQHVAVTHAETTLKNHFRPDFSSWHVLDYDTNTGEVLQKLTHQGYSNESAWARGQAWALYGFTMMYRESNNSKFLDQAIGIANFLLNHPNMPSDGVPYWDFDAPNIPNEERDASAGAIMASALLELSGYISGKLRSKYKAAAENTLATLSSSDYLAKPGTNGNFILKHSVGSKPGKSEVDVPLTYADYYYVEALLRYLSISK